MSPIPVIETDTFDIEDSDDIVGIAKSLVNGLHPGILCTVDQDGRPRCRWMSTFAFDEFPVFHTLTVQHSRKVTDIEHHADVSWMFFNHDKTLILNLAGKARVVADTRTCRRIWKKAKDKSHAYFLEQFGKLDGFAVIETKVNVIECTSPRSSLRFTVEPNELKHL